MAIGVGTKSPLNLAGAQVNSGLPNTGEQRLTQGGDQAASIYSGQVAPVLTGAPGAVATGADILLYSGAGRLKDILVHQGALSGVAIMFYDAAVVTSGGPFALSGHKHIGIIPASPPTGASGSFVAAGTYAFDFPFSSGLCVNSRSGQPGFTVTWIPDTNRAFPG